MNPDLSPEAVARLNDKKWRRSQSKWMLWIYLTSSSLGVVGFARIAIKTKDPVAKKYTYILSGILFALFVLLGLDNPTETVVDGETVTNSGALGTLGGILVFVNYGLQIFFSFKVNKIWLVYKAQDNNPNWVQQNISVKGVAQTLMQSPQDLVKDALGIDRSEYLAGSAPNSAQSSSKSSPPPPPLPKKSSPPPPPTNLNSGSKIQPSIDLNTVSVDELIQVAGIDPVLAANIIVQREKSQGFSSFDSFAATMQLQPHQIAKLKPLFDVQKPRGQQDDKPGRVLDI